MKPTVMPETGVHLGTVGFNAYDWNVEGNSGRIAPSGVRRFLARIAVDF